MYLPAVGDGSLLLRPRLERDDGLLAGLPVFQLDHTVGIPGLQKLCALLRDILPVAIGARNAIMKI